MTEVVLPPEAVHTLQFTGTGAFNPDTLAAAHASVDAAIANPEARVFVMRGEGKNFSQGLDLEYLMANPDQSGAFVKATMEFAGRLLTLGMPVVSVVNGHAFGLGAMLVLASDYAVMRRDRGFFCLPEVDIGMTLSVRMNALVRARMTGLAVRDSLLTGARLPAERALALGIVDAVGDEESLDELAITLAMPMLNKPRALLAGLKYGQVQDVVDLIYSDAKDDPIRAPE